MSQLTVLVLPPSGTEYPNAPNATPMATLKPRCPWYLPAPLCTLNHINFPILLPCCTNYRLTSFFPPPPLNRCACTIKSPRPYLNPWCNHCFILSLALNTVLFSLATTILKKGQVTFTKHIMIIWH